MLLNFGHHPQPLIFISRALCFSWRVHCCSAPYCVGPVVSVLKTRECLFFKTDLYGAFGEHCRSDLFQGHSSGWMKLERGIITAQYYPIRFRRILMGAHITCVLLCHCGLYSVEMIDQCISHLNQHHCPFLGCHFSEV